MFSVRNNTLAIKVTIFSIDLATEFIRMVNHATVNDTFGTAWIVNLPKPHLVIISRNGRWSVVCDISGYTTDRRRISTWELSEWTRRQQRSHSESLHWTIAPLATDRLVDRLIDWYYCTPTCWHRNTTLYSVKLWNSYNNELIRLTNSNRFVGVVDQIRFLRQSLTVWEQIGVR